jgi:hypothetical protein
MNSQISKFSQNRGSFSSSLTNSAHRAGLDAVPCTSTTGMRPVRCGRIMKSPSRNNFWAPIAKSPERKPAISKSQIGAPSKVRARADVVSYSIGFYIERPCSVRSVEFQLAAQFPRLERRARIREAKKSRGGDF